jgi:hypothetical protein
VSAALQHRPFRPIGYEPIFMRLKNSPHPVVLPARRRVFAGLLLLALTLAGTSYHVAGAGSNRADSREVKAVFLINFLSFAEWPPTKLGAPSGKFTIAVLGDPSFAALVESAAAGRVVSGRTITVHAIDTAEQAVTAHLLFIAPSQARRLPAVLRAVADATVLTVGDTDGFARDGVAINLYTFDNRVRIEVNSTAAARAGVKLSANLMRLARIVE